VIPPRAIIQKKVYRKFIIYKLQKGFSSKVNNKKDQV
jgi:hypothetical protein